MIPHGEARVGHPQAPMGNFHNLVRHRAEIIFGKDNHAAVSQWVTYWTDTLPRNTELVRAFRSRIEFDFRGKKVLAGR